MSKQSLIVLQSLWGMERRHPDGIEPSIEYNLTMIKEAGFDGISTSCIDPARVALIARALAGTGLAVEGMCFPKTIDDLKVAIDLGRRLAPCISTFKPTIARAASRTSRCWKAGSGWPRRPACRSMSRHIATE